MKRSTLEQKNSKNENEILEQFPTFPTLQTGFDWEEDFKTFEKEADEFMKEAQSWTEETRREMMKMQEEAYQGNRKVIQAILEKKEETK